MVDHGQRRLLWQSSNVWKAKQTAHWAFPQSVAKVYTVKTILFPLARWTDHGVQWTRQLPGSLLDQSMIFIMAKRSNGYNSGWRKNIRTVLSLTKCHGRTWYMSLDV
jgi:hypothetical protein